MSADPLVFRTLAMRTQFELFLVGDDVARLRAASEEAFDEVHSVERKVSFYEDTSDLCRVNTMAHEQPIRLDPVSFSLFVTSKELSEKTGELFDPTAGRLVQLWQKADGGKAPSVEEIDFALDFIGMDKVILNEDDSTVQFTTSGVSVDFGSIAKGFALARAGETLKLCGITDAFLDGGTSSGLAFGPSSWKIAIRHPVDGGIASTFELQDAAYSVSAPHGKTINVEGHAYGHLVDPRNGRPVPTGILAAVVGPDSSVCDALSTAMLLANEWETTLLTQRFSDYSFLIVGLHRIFTFGSVLFNHREA